MDLRDYAKCVVKNANYYRLTLELENSYLIICPGISIEIPKTDYKHFNRMPPNEVKKYFLYLADVDDKNQALKNNLQMISNLLGGLVKKQKPYEFSQPSLIKFECAETDNDFHNIFSVNIRELMLINIESQIHELAVVFLTACTSIAIYEDSTIESLQKTYFDNFWLHTSLGFRLFHQKSKYYYLGTNNLCNFSVLDSMYNGYNSFPTYNIVINDKSKYWQIDVTESELFELHARAVVAYLTGNFPVPLELYHY